MRVDTDKVYSECYAKKIATLSEAWRKTNKLTAAPYNAEASTSLWTTGCKNFFPDKKPISKVDLTKAVEATQGGDQVVSVFEM